MSDMDYVVKGFISSPEYLAGKKEFYAGADITANPYCIDNLTKRVRWRAGWQSAHLEILDKIQKVNEVLDEIERAYPQDVFPDTTQAERDPIIEKYYGFIDRTAAMMGRHLVKVIRQKLAGDKTTHGAGALTKEPIAIKDFPMRNAYPQRHKGKCENCGHPIENKWAKCDYCNFQKRRSC